MSMQDNEIGAFEAKTHLSELLRKAENGESFVILRRGRPVARLVPVGEKRGDHLKDAIAALQRIRNSIEGTVDIRELIEEGRRW